MKKIGLTTAPYVYDTIALFTNTIIGASRQKTAIERNCSARAAQHSSFNGAGSTPLVTNQLGPAACGTPLCHINALAHTRYWYVTAAKP